MSDKVNQGASVTPPVSGQNTIIRASVTSAERIRLPDDWTGYVTVQADGVKVYIALGGATVAAVIAHTTTLTSEAPSAHGSGECMMVASDGEAHVNLGEVRRTPAEPLYLSHIASATGGYVRLIRSSGSVPRA